MINYFGNLIHLFLIKLIMKNILFLVILRLGKIL